MGFTLDNLVSTINTKGMDIYNFSFGQYIF